MFFNPKKNNNNKVDSHLNYMGGKSYDLTNPLAKLRLAVHHVFLANLCITNVIKKIVEK